MVIVPLYKPSVSGIRTAQAQPVYERSWHYVLHDNHFLEPDGVLIKFKFKFD